MLIEEDDEASLDLNDKSNIKAQWAKHEREKRQNAVLLQQGNARYSANIESRNHTTLNLYSTDNQEFKFDPTISSM